MEYMSQEGWDKLVNELRKYQAYSLAHPILMHSMCIAVL